MVIAVQQIVPVDAAIDARNERRRQSDCEELWQLLDAVKDPEIPVLSLWELGVLRDVRSHENQVEVVIAPTYSGCPALETMRDDIDAVLRAAGYVDIDISIELTPAWHSGWISEAGRRQLHEYGIVLPVNRCSECQMAISCPQCGSEDTECISEFASTACKALYRCRHCLESFDYFKAI